MCQTIAMIKNLHPRIFVGIPHAKITLKNWKKKHVPKSAMAINSLLAHAFARYWNRMGQPYAAATLVIQQAGLLRPCKVLGLTRADIRLSGSIVMNGAGARVAGLMINNGKTSKNGKPQLAIIEEPTAVKILEILMMAKQHHSDDSSIFDNISYIFLSKQLQLAAQFFGLSDVKVTPHGPRLGGAVENFNSRIPLDDIACGGRWEDLETVPCRTFVTDKRR